MPAEKLSKPEELYSPPAGWEERVREATAQLGKSLSPEGAQEFMTQIVAAVAKAKAEGDLRPINVVLESWFRTLMFVTRPRFGELWAEAEKATGPELTLEDIRQRRAQRAR